jgi:hypothetical protein
MGSEDSIAPASIAAMAGGDREDRRLNLSASSMAGPSRGGQASARAGLRRLWVGVA